MAFEKIEKPGWRPFFDNITKLVEGKAVDVEVIGLDVGDQVEGPWLALDGITYDSGDDTLYVYVQATREQHLEHAIRSPKEIYVEFGDLGLSQVVAIESSGDKQFVRMRNPLRLPATT